MKGLLISDFNIENLASYLKKEPNAPAIESVSVCYGQVSQTLLDDAAPIWSERPDFVVAWTRPEGVLEAFRRMLDCCSVSENDLNEQVDEFTAALHRASRRTAAIFVPTWVISAFHQTHGLLDLSSSMGVARALMRINMRLIESLENIPTAHALWAEKWVQLAGPTAFNQRLWYLGKIPFSNEVFKAAARDLKAALRGLGGQAKKVIILDLDDVLWGGIVGDAGWQGLTLGGHDPAGEALVDFQRELKALTRRGILLAIVSKNEESVAMEAIAKHPEMVLKLDDFAGWRINWQDKAENILDLMTELNLGLDSVPEWPSDQRLYPEALLSLDRFDRPSVTEEDRQRSRMVAVDRERKQSKIHLGNLEEWLATLKTTVRVEQLNQANLPRAAQLLNKTNQMNLSTRRMSEAEFQTWARQKTRRAWTFRVSDRFGDSGVTGILSIEIDGLRARIIDFVLSCRVMGRKIEETMLYIASSWARSAGVQEVYAEYCQTPKNKPCYDFFQRSGLTYRGGNMFVWDAAKAYPLHGAIRLVCEDGGAFGKPSIYINPSELITDGDGLREGGINADLTHR
jgi:predicted enzyme involved in methoxymalonyl-ACP biosynthesis